MFKDIFGALSIIYDRTFSNGKKFMQLMNLTEFESYLKENLFFIDLLILSLSFLYFEAYVNVANFVQEFLDQPH